MKTIDELNSVGHVCRYKPVVFSGGPVPSAPQRKDKYPDDFDVIFSSKEEYTEWYKGLVSGLAELDECLNYCQHFIREKGNEGKYVRDGKSYPVNGSWCGTHDYGRGEGGKFFTWVKENFGNDWFVLMDRYK